MQLMKGLIDKKPVTALTPVEEDLLALASRIERYIHSIGIASPRPRAVILLTPPRSALIADRTG